MRRHLFLIKAIIAIVLIIALGFGLYSCKGNTELLDGFTKESNTFDYAMIELPNGEVYEGEIDKWRDYSSDAVKVRFKNGQVIVTSYNKAVLFKIKP